MTGLHFEKMGGLLPAVVQDAETMQVLMVGYMNEAALAQTERTGKVTFFSRSKQRLWEKGETSGDTLQLVSITGDCDGDALLVLARPLGPTCHRKTASCFGDASAPGIGFLPHLAKVVDDRFRQKPERSYTTQLIEKGIDRMAQKVGEESVEVVIAAKNADPQPLVEESADLLFHLLVLWRAREVSLSAIVEKLRARHR